MCSADISRFKFTSKERNPFTGFSYYGYRFYAPHGVARRAGWISGDAIGERVGNSLHEFVRNKPLILIDPGDQISIVAIVIGLVFLYPGKDAYDYWRCSKALCRWQGAVLKC